MQCTLVHIKINDNGVIFDYRLATSPFDVVLNGATFTATGDLLKITDSEETNEISKTGITVQLDGLNQQFQAEIDAGNFVRSPIDVYIANVPDGTNVVDTYEFYHRGYCDTPTMNVDYETGSVMVSVDTTNIFTDLDRIPDLMRSSMASHSSRHNGDKFFEYVANGEGEAIWYI